MYKINSESQRINVGNNVVYSKAPDDTLRRTCDRGRWIHLEGQEAFCVVCSKYLLLSHLL